MNDGGGEEAFAELAHDLRRSVSAFIRAVRHDTGMQRSAQSETLDLLHRDRPMNVASLASRRGVTHQTMRLVVAQLETNGLVRQDTYPADRRGRLVTLTPAGGDALERKRAARTSHIEDAIHRLSLQQQGIVRAALPLLDRSSSPPDERHRAAPNRSRKGSFDGKGRFRSTSRARGGPRFPETCSRLSFPETAYQRRRKGNWADDANRGSTTAL